MVDMIPQINTRGDKQPDSCFAFFDPNAVDIAVNILAGIGSDHEILQIQVRKSEIVAEIPKFKKMVKRVQCVSDSDLKKKLGEAINQWYVKWERKLGNTSEDILNKACRTFVETLHQVQATCFRKKY